MRIDRDISNLPKRNQLNQILLALYHGDNVVREGYYIVNNIGGTTYISFDDLTPTELRKIALFKQKATK
jgi:hypothetical protein